MCSRFLNGSGCPFLAKNPRVWKGFNDLATTHPEIAAQWHPTKNGNLTPEDVVVGSNKKAWWYLPYKDPRTGKFFIFEWEAVIKSRLRNGCPFLSGQKVWKGFNDLATTHPEIAAQWHPTKNGNITPQDVIAGCLRKFWWRAAKIDQETGKESFEEHFASVRSRVHSSIDLFSRFSKGEQYVKQYLDRNYVKYHFEKKFKNLRGIGNSFLSFDFEIPKNNILIEYQGRQHYEPVKWFGGNEKFKRQRENDNSKRKFAQAHGYHLIEIPYTCNTYKKVEKLLDETLLPLVKKKTKAA